MSSLSCRIFVLLLMALPCSIGTRGILPRQCAESEPTNESETEAAASVVEAITGGARESLRRHRHPACTLGWTIIASPQQARNAYRIRPVRFLPGHRLPNGLNAPLLA